MGRQVGPGRGGGGCGPTLTSPFPATCDATAGMPDLTGSVTEVRPLPRPVRVVLISGFESFNVQLYRQAASQLAKMCPGLNLQVRLLPAAK